MHIWTLDLSATSEQITQAELTLSPAEVARAHSFKFPWLSRRYTLAHAALRSLLGYYSQVRPTGLQFVTGTHGKPALAGSTRLHFNLSGSGEMALVGVSLDFRLGVDIEQVRPLSNFESLAKAVLTPAEAVVLAAVPEPEKLGCFFRFWTRKEACLKAAGCGLSVEASTLECLSRRFRWRDGADTPFHVQGWTLDELKPAPGYVGALVTERDARSPIPRIRICSSSASNLLSEGARTED